MALTTEEIEGVVRMRDEMSSKLGQINRNVGKTGGLLKTATGTLLGFVGAQLGIGSISQAFSFVKSAAIDMNATLESTTLQFETLMGDANRAEAHVRSLFEFAKRTPFATGPIIEASKMMQTFGGDVLNTKNNLTLLGDASAATGAPIDQLGFWVGRLYSMLQAGKPFGEAAMRLQELAVLSPKARAEMERLQQSGASAQDVFKAFQQDLGKFSGSMEKQAETWSGAVSTFWDTVQLTIANKSTGAFDILRKAVISANSAMANMDLTGIEKQAAELSGLVRWERELSKAVDEQIAVRGRARGIDVIRLKQLREEIKEGKAAKQQVDIRRQAEEAFAYARDQRIQQESVVVAAEDASRAAAEAHRLEVEKLTEKIGNRGAAGEAALLAQAWVNLTDKERANEAIVREVLKAYQDLKPFLGRSGVQGVLEELALSQLKVHQGSVQLSQDARDSARAWWKSSQAQAKAIEEHQEMIRGLKTQSDALMSTEDATIDLTDEVIRLSKAWRKSSDEQAGAIASAKGIRGVFNSLKTVVGDLNSVFQAAFEGGGGVAGALKSLFTSALAGIGQVIGGPVGQIIGEFAGAIVSGLARLGKAIGGLFGGRSIARNIELTVEREWGLSVSEGLSKAIEKARKDGKYKSDIAALMGSISDVIAENGGVLAVGIDKSISMVRDLFVMLDTGQLSVTEVGREFDKVFGQLVPHAIDSATGVAKASFTELVGLARSAGVVSKNLATFLLGQSKQGIAALHAFVDAGQARTVNGAMVAQASAVAFFQAAIDGGASFSKALADIAPLLKKIEDDMGRLPPQMDGLPAAIVPAIPAFQRLKEAAKLVTDEVSGPLIKGAEAAGQVMVNLANIAQLDQRSFAILGDTVTDAFQRLLKGGATSEVALLALRQPIAQIIKLQEQYGFEVDDTTQAMIDAAKQAGITGADAKSAADLQREAQELTNDTLVAMRDILSQIRDFMVGDLTGGIQSTESALSGLERTGTGAFHEVQISARDLWTAVGDVDRELGSVNWSGFQQDAESAIQAVIDRVDTLSFGSSPGGIKEWKILLADSSDAFKRWGGEAKREIDVVNRSLNAALQSGQGALVQQLAGQGLSIREIAARLGIPRELVDKLFDRLRLNPARPKTLARGGDVSRTGLARVHKGESVANLAVLVEEMRQLRREVRRIPRGMRDATQRGR